MYCSHCGTELYDDPTSCPSCGRPLGMSPRNSPPAETAVTGRGSVGFSSKINDPAYAGYQKASGKWSILFAVILAVIAVVGMPIYGHMSGEVEMPQSLYYGMIIGGMFIVIALAQLARTNRDTTWDGVVVSKRMFDRRDSDSNSETFTTHKVYEYKVKRDSGKVYTHQTNDDNTMFDYFDVGDRVRHHKGFAVYEKYDKSKDDIIFCVACYTMNKISDDVCARCKCPLLK